MVKYYFSSPIAYCTLSLINSLIFSAITGCRESTCTSLGNFALMSTKTIRLWKNRLLCPIGMTEDIVIRVRVDKCRIEIRNHTEGNPDELEVILNPGHYSAIETESVKSIDDYSFFEYDISNCNLQWNNYLNFTLSYTGQDCSYVLSFVSFYSLGNEKSIRIQDFVTGLQ